MTVHFGNVVALNDSDHVARTKEGSAHTTPTIFLSSATILLGPGFSVSMNTQADAFILLSPTWTEREWRYEVSGTQPILA
jgi:hypothetical protein